MIPAKTGQLETLDISSSKIFLPDFFFSLLARFFPKKTRFRINFIQPNIISAADVLLPPEPGAHVRRQDHEPDEADEADAGPGGRAGKRGSGQGTLDGFRVSSE